MIKSVDFEQVIIQGIKGLPKQYLSEVADFVLFIRQKSLQKKDFYDLEAIQKDMSLLNERELSHLEDEFKDFDKDFPKE
ncbi:MAG: hypothetical protein ACK4NY_02960 [Spirosomataceae bacterium]